MVPPLECLSGSEWPRELWKSEARPAVGGANRDSAGPVRRYCPARTELGKLKVAPHIAERVLNHVQPGMTDVYDRGAYLDEKREALQRWAERLNTLRA